MPRPRAATSARPDPAELGFPRPLRPAPVAGLSHSPPMEPGAVAAVLSTPPRGLGHAPPARFTRPPLHGPCRPGRRAPHRTLPGHLPPRTPASTGSTCRGRPPDHASRSSRRTMRRGWSAGCPLPWREATRTERNAAIAREAHLYCRDAYGPKGTPYQDPPASCDRGLSAGGHTPRPSTGVPSARWVRRMPAATGEADATWQHRGKSVKSVTETHHRHLRDCHDKAPTDR